MWAQCWSLLFENTRFLFASLLILLSHLLWTRRKLYVVSWSLPGPWALPLIGNAQLITYSNLGDKLAEYTLNSANKLARLWVGTDLYILIGNADVAHQVATEIEKPDFYKYLGGGYLKGGLVMATNEDEWRRARKIWSPLFTLQNLKAFLFNFHYESLKTVEYLDATAGESFYPLEQTRHLSFASAMRNFFDIRPFTPDESKPYEENIDAMFHHFQRKCLMPLYKSNFLYWLVGFRQKENEVMRKFEEGATEILEESLRNLEIEQRHLEYSPEQTTGSEGKSANAFLRVLASNRDVTQEEARIQAITIMGSTTDTTKAMNMVTLLMLALNQEVQEKVYKEVTELLGKDITKVPTYEDLMKLEYLDRVLKECLRMYSAGPMFAKKLSQDLKITTSDGDYTIPTGTTMVTLVYSMHNDPDYFPNPKQFDPDRWLPEPSTQRHPHCYIPFSSGARHCIGSKYALLAMKVFTTSVVRAFEVLPSEQCPAMSDVCVENIMSGTLRLKENCQIRLRRRFRAHEPQ